LRYYVGTMQKPEYLIIGSGLTGATIARLLHDAGKRVLVLESRSHPGGNVWDDIYEDTGIWYHLYGPHYFRTDSERVWAFVNRFCNWRPWAARVSIEHKDKLRPWPLTPEELAEFGKIEPPERVENFRDACLTKMPRAAYEAFVEPYNLKQWGVSPLQLKPTLAGRIDTAGDDPLRRLKPQRYQAQPMGGYQALIKNMLRDIPVEVGHHFELDEWSGDGHLVFTGSIDELFDKRFGPLPYRSQERAVVYYPFQSQREWPTPQVNFPSLLDIPIRGIEWRHLGPPTTKWGALITWEMPRAGGLEYPIPTFEAEALYERYRALLPELERVTVAGRLGRFQYLDMDQAIGAAMVLAGRLLKGEKDPA
jgi:UDP-galactopyranose mutase